MLRFPASLLALSLFANVASAQDAEGVATRFTHLAAKSDAVSMAALFHYPPSYSETERHDETKAISESLKWLLSRVGAPQDVQPRNSPADFYEVGVFGGDNSYWESISPIAEAQFIYDATFPKMGPGYVKVLVIHPRPGSRPEIHLAGFGIPTESPGAKGKAIELIVGLIEQSGTPTPPGLRETLEQQLQPSHAAPGG